SLDPEVDLAPLIAEVGDRPDLGAILRVARAWRRRADDPGAAAADAREAVALARRGGVDDLVATAICVLVDCLDALGDHVGALSALGGAWRVLDPDVRAEI